MGPGGCCGPAPTPKRGFGREQGPQNRAAAAGGWDGAGGHRPRSYPKRGPMSYCRALSVLFGPKAVIWGILVLSGVRGSVRAAHVPSLGCARCQYGTAGASLGSGCGALRTRHVPAAGGSPRAAHPPAVPLRETLRARRPSLIRGHHLRCRDGDGVSVPPPTPQPPGTAALPSPAGTAAVSKREPGRVLVRSQGG